MDRLTPSEKKFLKKLNTPKKIQDFLDSIFFNHEEHGETCMSPRSVLREKKAHCIEGALFAATALWLHKKEPLVLNLKVMKGDFDHVVTLYKENGYWGAVSKTNHSVLRFRDPIYKTVRELALSYFHEYFLVKNGKKTLLGYSRPINLKHFGAKWITSSEDLWDIAEKIYDSKYVAIVPEKNQRCIRNATWAERKAASIPVS